MAPAALPLYKRIGQGFKLERFKFGVYLLVPIAAVLFYSVPSVHEASIKGRRYIVYTPSDVPTFNSRRKREADVSEDEDDVESSAGNSVAATGEGGRA